MIEKHYLVVLGAVSLTAAACTSEIAQPGPGGAGTTAGVPGGTTAGTDGGTAGVPPGSVGIDSNGDGIIDGYDTNGDGIIDIPIVDTNDDGVPDTPVVPDPGTPTSNCTPGIPATSQVSRLLNREYDNIVQDLLGVTTLASAGNQRPSSLLNTDFEGAMNSYSWAAYLDAADKVAAEVIAGPNRSMFMACDPATVATCYEDTIRSFGRKAFRRPLTDEEVARFLTLTALQPQGTPDEIAEALLYAFLASPSFIMVPEMSPEVEGTALKLTNHEVATRLSLMLWGSVPDDELNAAADAGMLSTKEQILAQAQRMLQNRTKAGPQVASAHRSYMEMENASSHWWKMEHDTTMFPYYSTELMPVMLEEYNAFFEEVVFTGGSFKDLFLSPLAFVNQQTAPIYGLDPSAYGADLTPVQLDPTQRPGMLTRAGFLSSFSNFAATSPILRGAFITVNIIGLDPGAPDPSAIQTPIPEGNYTTRRQQIEKLTEPVGCNGCHGAYVNPPGFVLETFDAVGGVQTVDPLGGPIDSTATVSFTDTNVKTISTPLEMMQEIANTPLSRRIYAEKLVAHATGRLPNANDACVVDELNTKLATDGYTVLNLVADLTQADSFRLRTVGN